MIRGLKRVGIGCGVGVVIAYLLLLGTFKFVFPMYRNTTAGMDPTVGAGDFVITNRSEDVHRGDVIVHAYPLQPKTFFIKRVIGVPGDVVLIRDKQVFVNGRQLSEPYAVHSDSNIYPLDPRLPEPYRSRDQFGPFTVAAGQVFVLGDNRDRSADSRFWGTVPQSYVRGHVLFVMSRVSGWHRVAPAAWVLL